MRKSKSVLLVESAKFQSHLYYRARKRDNELAQRCVRCPKTVDDGYACCKECREKMSDGKLAAIQEQMCLDCWTEPVVSGKRYCATHDRQRKQRNAEQYTQRLVRHICVRCGDKRAQAGFVLCEVCTVKVQAYKLKKKLVVQSD